MLLNIVPVSRNKARVSTFMMSFGDFFIQNINSAKKVRNGKNGRAASSGDRILPVLYLYDLYILTTTIGTLDKALACNRNSNPRPSGMPNGNDRFQYSNVPNHVVKNISVEPHMPKSYPHGKYRTPGMNLIEIMLKFVKLTKKIDQKMCNERTCIVFLKMRYEKIEQHHPDNEIHSNWWYRSGTSSKDTVQTRWNQRRRV